MFSFHKPKIYRSISGCCICKAKSSSSRFTDSKKYEAEFEKCFRITEKRSGEICNACVLLVKRWKKLPPGTQRDWRHVVDARAGPGTKSFKNVKLSNGTTNGVSSSSSSSALSNHNKKHQKPKKVRPSKVDSSNNGPGDEPLNVSANSLKQINNLIGGSDSSEADDDDEDEDEDDEDYLSEDYEDGDNTKRKIRTRSQASPKDGKGNIVRSQNSIKSNCKRNRNNAKNGNGVSKISSFLDMSFWRKEKICCGIIFKGPANVALICPELLKPCPCRMSAMKLASNSSLESGSPVSSTSPVEDDTNSNASSSNFLI